MSDNRQFDREWNITVVALIIVVVVALFLPTDAASYNNAGAWLKRTAHYLKYRIPCAAPESSFIGKWVRSRGVDCSKL